jgi:hypothetical protein
LTGPVSQGVHADCTLWPRFVSMQRQPRCTLYLYCVCVPDRPCDLMKYLQLSGVFGSQRPDAQGHVCCTGSWTSHECCGRSVQELMPRRNRHQFMAEPRRGRHPFEEGLRCWVVHLVAPSAPYPQQHYSTAYWHGTTLQITRTRAQRAETMQHTKVRTGTGQSFSI